MSTLTRLAPITGLLAIVLIIIGALVGGEIPDLEDGIDEVAAFYVENDGAQMAGGILLAYGTALLLAFLVILRSVLRGPDDRGSEAATAALAGGIVLAVGLLLFAGLGFALGDLADDLDPVAIQALHALNEDLFMPMAVGTAVLMWGVTFAILRGAPLPRWLGWAALVIAVVSITPVGFIAILATGIWVAVVSVILTLRARAPGPGVPPAEHRPPPA